MEIKDKVELTDVSKIFIKNFDEGMNKFQYNQLIFVFINDCDKIQWSVSFVDDFVVFVLDKVAHFWFTGKYELIDLKLHKKWRTSLRNFCFSCWERLWLYHLVRRERPCLLIRKKQWIISIFKCYFFNLIKNAYYTNH